FPDNSDIPIPIPGNRLAINDGPGDDRHLYDYNGKRLSDSLVEIFWVNDNAMWINLPDMRGFLRPNGAFVPIVKGFSLISWWDERKGSLIKTYKLTESKYAEDGPMDVYGWIDTRNGNFMPPHFDQVEFWNDKIIAHSGGITYVFSQENELIRRLEGYAHFFPGAPCIIYSPYDHSALIDTAFQYLTSPSYERIVAAEWGGFLFTRDGKWGLLDTKGKELLPPQYDQIEPSEPHSQLLIVQLAEKKGVETMNGQTVLEAKFEFIRGISGSNFVVRISDKYGIITIKNEVLLPFEYDSVRIRSDGRLIVVRRGDHFGMVNFKGEILLPVEYEQLAMEDYGWIVGVRNGLYNAWNANIVGMDAFKYDWWSPEYPYGFIVKKNGKAGFINLLGKELLPPEYDDIRRVNTNPGLYHTVKNGQTTVFKP
ncbi:MAG TPA: WG repeat-containing protein, partial [Saprospiraceae bacterium]|nr:WG repeat-containing protein [Saprospiraceae bacterium]